VNLGRERRVNMAALRELLDAQGHGNVRTYLQSGNVVLESTLTAPKLEHALERQLVEGLGFEVDVLVRSGAELSKILAANPLRALAKDPSRYLVTFLRRAPDRSLIRRLEAGQASPERVVAVGRELFSWHPGGIGRSELAKLLQPKKLGMAASARNWRVVEKLESLASGE
jgi:uncharacterized protein (DUF1697 family)